MISPLRSLKLLFTDEIFFCLKLQFGELQVAVSPEKAYAGAAIAFVFGYLCGSFVCYF